MLMALLPVIFFTPRPPTFVCAAPARRMPTVGPCANPGCKERDNASGQFSLLPEEFLAREPPPVLFGDSGAHCAKRPCRRWCGKLPPAGTSAKRAAADGGSSSPVPVPVDGVGPRPSTIVSIDEIWAERCALVLACPACARPCTADPSALRARVRVRCVDISTMSGVARRNKLLAYVPSRADKLEYAVHGKWRLESDENGEHGCWHVDVRTLVEAFGADAVRAKLAAFAAEQAVAREAAIVAAEEAIAAAATAAAGAEEEEEDG